jgi:hypothetical protein
MIRTAARRKTDGLLADIQVSMLYPAHPERRLENAVQEVGGALAEWELVTLPDTVWQNIDPRNSLFATLERGAVTKIDQKKNKTRSLEVLAGQPELKLARAQWDMLTVEAKLDALRDALAALLNI